MDLIVEMHVGSHLYGTATPQSDLDLKGVYLPAARDILLQRVSPSLSAARPKQAGEKNEAGDVDRELYSLQRFLDLLADGQTVALDMLFAPDAAMIQPAAPLWREVQALAPRVVSRRASAFVRYCRQQANKFGIKGSRVATARQALALLADAEARHGSTAKLECIADALVGFVAAHEHAALVDLPQPGGRVGRCFEVCGRKMLYTASLKTAREIVDKLVREYGQRALAAERNDGVDWKALSHAVRVGREAVELFTTGQITFPRPEASHLLAIRQGRLDFAAVAAEVEALLDAVERAAAVSALPEEPDRQAIDDLVARAYRAQVLAGP